MKRVNLGQYDTSEAFLNKGRFYVRVKHGDRRTSLPRAVYNWLKYNPSFIEMPKGYVVHHLDLDPLNDDPSNIVLMHRYHHVAYHRKHKNVETEIQIDEHNRDYFLPTRPPRVLYRKNNDKYFINFFERGFGGKLRRVNLSRDKNNNMFYTKEQAQNYADEIWKSANDIRDGLEA